MNRTAKIIIAILVLIIIGGGIAAGYYVAHNKASQVVTQSQTSSNQKQKSSNTNNASQAASDIQPVSTTCQANELALSSKPDPSGAAAGSQFIDAVLTNKGGRTCTAYGFPGVSLTDSNGRQVGQPAERSPSGTATALTLKPGSAAISVLQVPNAGNFPSGQCTSGATMLKVYPPANTVALTAATDITNWCPGFSVQALKSE